MIGRLSFREEEAAEDVSEDMLGVLLDAVLLFRLLDDKENLRIQDGEVNCCCGDLVDGCSALLLYARAGLVGGALQACEMLLLLLLCSNDPII